MSKSIDSIFWTSLGNDGSLLFGKECGSAALWMILALVQRSVVAFLRIESFVPYGFLYSFPLLIQHVGQVLPFLQDHFPILPVRIAEAVMNRITPSQIMLIIPAHFLGSIVGVVVFKTVFPFAPSSVVGQFTFQGSTMGLGLLVDVLAVFAYVVMVIILPELLAVNRLNSKILSASLVPMMFVRRSSSWCVFNPSVIYALWYLNRVLPESFADSGSSISGSSWWWWSSSTGSLSGWTAYSTGLPVAYIIGPLVGAILAGMFCNYTFPDNNSSWKYSTSNRFMNS
mmetsp:Transcript_14638/g.24230  ORF Transcript_14638/g.24230 Transcript_14638/m.24230 type:complete len:284 (-) Transcript_14638:1106-1957(-)